MPCTSASFCWVVKFPEALQWGTEGSSTVPPPRWSGYPHLSCVCYLLSWVMNFLTSSPSYLNQLLFLQSSNERKSPSASKNVWPKDERGRGRGRKREEEGREEEYGSWRKEGWGEMRERQYKQEQAVSCPSALYPGYLLRASVEVLHQDRNLACTQLCLAWASRIQSVVGEEWRTRVSHVAEESQGSSHVTQVSQSVKKEWSVKTACLFLSS